MGSVSEIAKMKVFAVVLAAVASVSGVGAIGNRAVYGGHLGYYGKREAEPYTVGQVAAGLPLHNAALDGRLHNPGLITGVSYGAYGHGLGYYGKRDAEAEPYTIGQVYAGLPVANAYATGHPHNIGYTTYVSHGLGYYGKREAEAEPYPIGQVYAGLPIANAYATGHPHNVGYTAYVSHGLGYYGKREAE